MSNLSLQSNSFKLNIPNFNTTSPSRTINPTTTTNFHKNSLSDLSKVAISALYSVNNFQDQQPRNLVRSDSIDSDMSSTSNDRSVSPVGRQPQVIFVHKLYNMLNDDNLQEYLRWSPKGDSFYVFHGERFNKNILAVFFKHTNMSSFIRQLNMYGFHKVNEAAKDKNGNDFTLSDLEKPNNRWEFRHSQNLFKKGDTLSLNNIKRRSSKNNINSQKNVINLESIAQAAITKDESNEEQISPKQREDDASPNSSYFQPTHIQPFSIKLQSPMTPSSSSLSNNYQHNINLVAQQQPIFAINPQTQLPPPPPQQGPYEQLTQQPSMEYIHSNEHFNVPQRTSIIDNNSNNNQQKHFDHIYEELNNLKRSTNELYSMYQIQQNVLINFLNLYEDNKLDSITISNLKNCITSSPQPQQPQPPHDLMLRKNSSYSPLSSSRHNSTPFYRTNSLPLTQEENSTKLPSVEQLNIKIRSPYTTNGPEFKKRKL
ncbi:SFL1 [Candida jiufengensis]|uniref:SFL1 n=1 Tax=Candida jiufengensis TaxID=497108 RepID=UPI0022246452|nr:SFL1 [Candida jiufengensis]KAI5954228.1 SFL1 [Candida jiufengensis]